MWTPPEPVADSEFSPLEDAADRFLTPCRHSPLPAIATPSRHAVIAWRRGLCRSFFEAWITEYTVWRFKILQGGGGGCFGW